MGANLTSEVTRDEVIRKKDVGVTVEEEEGKEKGDRERGTEKILYPL